ncbi:MAG: ABC transporter substrate-binding protein [Rhodospirillales bacterium]|nr:ABC transporter substrate-binding protein [Rhodospirillales bacterium]
MTFRRWFAAFALLSLGLAANPAQAAGKSAEDVITAFHGQLLAVMKEADSLGINGRYQRLKAPVTGTIDLSRMIRIASGSFWHKATPEERSKLLQAFTHLSISTYAARFDGYSGQRFETTGSQPGPQQTILVKTRIVNGEESIPLTYVLKQSDGIWRVADILLKNTISELAVRRSEYRRILKQSGTEGLRQALAAKAAAMLSGK